MILVTGGAGYIGSHTVRQLVDAGEKVVVLDNLCSGFRWAVPQGVDLVVGDCGDTRLVRSVLEKYQVRSVIHFAAHLFVDESVEKPLKYYLNNTVGTTRLIETCGTYGVDHFIFSSTCAAYGLPRSNPVTELEITDPISPYGRSKLASEWVLRDLAHAKTFNMRSVILRYFNVAGARTDLGLGQGTVGARQLIKVAAETALGYHKSLKVFGTDYPTPDGTCIRDYIHVGDLADAHVLGLEYLRQGGDSDVFNCGYGTGTSVKEIVTIMKKVTGVDFPVEYADRRPGDATAIFADNRKIEAKLGWKPRFNDLELICKSTVDFEQILVAKRREASVPTEQLEPARGSGAECR